MMTMPPGVVNPKTNHKEELQNDCEDSVVVFVVVLLEVVLLDLGASLLPWCPGFFGHGLPDPIWD